MKNYFTITAGRTGSAWLTSFLSANLNIQAVHEPLDINDFGVIMPDIKIMRNFNNFGNNELVQSFWIKKFSHIKNDVYAETNHTLCKCGLVENVILNGLEDVTTLIVLKRNIIKQCVSYIVRNDFQNITLAWQWYLHPTYAKKIINPEPFIKLGVLGLPLWYCYEMSARQEYYSQKFSNKVEMHHVALEDVTKKSGAQDFLKALGLNGVCKLPSPKNENKLKPSDQLVDNVSKIVSRVNVDMPQIVEDIIKKGFNFSES